MAWVIGIIVIILLVGLVVGSVQQSDENNARIDRLSALPGFKDALLFAKADARCAMAVSTSLPALALAQGDQLRVFKPSQVLAVEIEEYGSSVTKSQGSRLGRAAVGGLVLGPAGAIVGALSVSTRTSAQVSKLRLRLTLDDLESPRFEMPFFASPQPVSRSSIGFAAAEREANTWLDRITALMNRTDPTDVHLAELAATPSQVIPEHMLESDRAALMKRYGISKSGSQFSVGAHRYDDLSAAVSYAQLLAAKAL
jgi:hypothetical protein